MNTLDHLLEIEAEAAALVKDAQAEADRRIHENEEKNRASYDEFFKQESYRLEASLSGEKEKITEQYQKAIDEYRKEISGVNTDINKFASMFDKFLAGEG
ncbi:MAG: hypothetical protein LBH16_00805 [Treponema sp.]|jgi:vacuolar-type H+-ATPase subunit H|nr:hypothetical protein [Treponema sp.]